MPSDALTIIGGTGALGRALALRALRHGIRVCIGSRMAARAEAVARELRHEIPGAEVTAAANAEAAAAGELIAVTVPFASQRETLLSIRDAAKGKIVIDTTVPLVPPRIARVQLPPEGCAAVRAQNELGPEARVVSALHTVAAARLGSSAGAQEIGDILVFGDDKASREVVVALLARMDLSALHGGSLANSAATEAFTSVLIFMNKHYGADHAGLRLIGIRPPRPQTPPG
ncbi:MAG TPA: NAD(P)-binding domain-containing protein [Steroidobacteraceae bacterium]|nr:NAD(P)-binding domain-containing protein [Steroidobacteraceae bacterium]